MAGLAWSTTQEIAEVADAAAFELEDAFRFAAAEQRVGLLVVEREAVRVDLLARRLLDQSDDVREDRQVPQAEDGRL